MNTLGIDLSIPRFTRPTSIFTPSGTVTPRRTVDNITLANPFYSASSSVPQSFGVAPVAHSGIVKPIIIGVVAATIAGLILARIK